MTYDQPGKLRTDQISLRHENRGWDSDATHLNETPTDCNPEDYILRHYAEERLKSLGVLQ